MRYVVMFTDATTGATSEIDFIATDDTYTAQQYIADCERNADDEYVEMLHSGNVALVEIE